MKSGFCGLHQYSHHLPSKGQMIQHLNDQMFEFIITSTAPIYQSETGKSEKQNPLFGRQELPEFGMDMDIGVGLLLGILGRSGGILLGILGSSGGILLGILGSFGGILLGKGCVSLMSTTTASDVRKVLATDAACSKQHLTTCPIFDREL